MIKKIIKYSSFIIILSLTLIFNFIKPSLIEAADDFRIEGTTLTSYNGDASIVTIPDGINIIGQGAFQDNTEIAKVIIPESVKIIELRAFYGCYNLSEINLEGVEKFGEMVFEGAAISSVNLSKELTELPLGLFANTRIASIELGDKVTVIGSSVFYQCSLLTNINIPESVYSIGDQAFYKCTKLKSITLPKNLLSIGSKCFAGSGLVEIDVPNNIKELGSQAFNECLDLTKVTLHEGLEVINYLSISNTSITTLNIPSTVNEIDLFAFANNIKLEKINVDVNNTSFISDDGILYSEGYELLVKIPINYQKDEVTLKEGLIETAEQSCTNLKNVQKVVFPEGLIKIEHSTFSLCERLEEVILPTTIETINSGVFEGCTLLSIINLPTGLKHLASTEWYIGVFARCSSLTEVIIPDTVESIGPYTFQGCTNLKRVVIPGGVSDYGIKQFSECANLSEIIVKEGNQFAYTKDGVYYEIVDGESQLAVYPALLPGKTYTIPADITTICDNAFNSLANLEEVIIPETVKKLGLSIFASSTSLKKVIFQNDFSELPNGTFFKSSIEEVVLPTNLKTIGASSFGFCKELKHIDLPESLITINDIAFYESGLESIEIPDNVISIGQAFMYTKSLRSIKLSNSLQTLSASSFNSSLITEIRIPESMVEIPYAAFYNCQLLETVYIPKSITTFTVMSFGECPNLKDIIVDEGNQYIKQQDGILYDQEYKTILYVNKKTVSEKIVLPDTLEEVPSKTFYGITNIKEIFIPKSVVTYGWEAMVNASFEKVELEEGTEVVEDFLFRGCSKLKEVILPSTIKAINTAAFEECTSLETINLPENVSLSESYSAFSKCISLKSFTFPKNITSIPQYIFRECISLSNIVIPDTVTKIEMNAFEGCKNITNLIIPTSVTTIETDIIKDTGIKELIMLCNAPILKTNNFSTVHFPSDCTIYVLPNATGYTGSTYRAYTKQIKKIDNNCFNEHLDLTLINNGDHTITLEVDTPYANEIAFYIKNEVGEYELLIQGNEKVYLYTGSLGDKTYDFKVSSIINNQNKQYISSIENSIYINKNDEDYQMDYLLMLINSLDENTLALYQENELKVIIDQYDALSASLKAYVDENSTINNIVTRYNDLLAYKDDINKITNIELSIVNTQLTIGEVSQISVIFKEDVINKEVKYKSSNERIVKIDEKGIVTALTTGKASITVTALNGVSESIDLEVIINNSVIEPKKDYTGLVIIIISAVIIVGGSVTFILLKKRGQKNA